MKTWLITGCSSGFGQRLALATAQRSDIDAWREITIATDFDQPSARAANSVWTSTSTGK